MNPLISFIISTRGKDASVLANALLSIFNTINSEQAEVIVIDQNQSPAIEKICLSQQFSAVKYVASDTVGLARGRNVGIKEAKGDWLWFFDDDATLPHDWIAEILADLESARAGSTIFYGTVYDLTGGKYLRRGSTSARLNRWQFDGVCSIGIIFNRRVLDTIGVFDEQFGVGSIYGAGEESDMLLRAFEQHIPIIFCKNFKIFHPRSMRIPAKANNYGFGVGALYRKHFFDSLPTFLVLVIKLLIENLIRLIFCIFFGLSGRGISAKFHWFYLLAFWRGFISYKV